MLNPSDVTKLNELLDALGEVKEELAKVNALKKRQRMIEKTIKTILLNNEECIYENSDWRVTIDKAIKDKVTEAKIMDIIEAFEANTLDSLTYEDFCEPKESVSMKIKKVKKGDNE